MIQRRSTESGPARDEAMAEETKPLTRSGREPRTEEWREKEPPGEDQPEVDMAPGTTLSGGTPAGMTEHDVEMRNELARHIRPRSFPVDKDDLLVQLREATAPDYLIESVRRLPAGQQFANVQEVTEALHWGVERRRS